MERRKFLKLSVSSLGLASTSGCIKPFQDQEEQTNNTMKARDITSFINGPPDISSSSQIINFEPTKDQPIKIEISITNNTDNSYILENVVTDETIGTRTSDNNQIVLLRSREWGEENTEIVNNCYNLSDNTAYPTSKGSTDIGPSQSVSTVYDLFVHPKASNCPEPGIHKFTSFVTVNHTIGDALEGEVKMETRISTQ